MSGWNGVRTTQGGALETSPVVIKAVDSRAAAGFRAKGGEAPSRPLLSDCRVRALILFAVLGACSAKDPATSPGGTCTQLVAAAVVAPDMPTVMTVRWTTDAPGTSAVEWGYDGGGSYRASGPTGEEAVTDHAVVVAGMAPGSTVWWRARSTLPDEACTSPDHTLNVASSNDRLSTVRLDSSAAGFTPGFRLVPVAGTTPGVIVVDDEGREVWWDAPRTGLKPVQAWLDHDEQHVLYLVESGSALKDDGGIMRVSLDRRDSTFLPLSHCHHAFLQLPDGRFAYLAADARAVDGADRDIAGDAVVVVDADGGNPTPIYSTWDNYTPDPTALNADPGTFYPNWLDWTHANSLNLRPDGTLLLSLHNLDMVVNLTLDGEVVWTLGGADPDAPGDFTYVGDPSDLFEHQHNPIDVGDPDDPATNGNLLVFDNGPNELGGYSEVTEYTLDEGAFTFTPTWSFEFGQQQLVAQQGDVQRLANGDTFIDWGANGLLNEVTPEGRVVWQASDGGKIFGFAQQYDALGGAVPSGG